MGPRRRYLALAGLLLAGVALAAPARARDGYPDYPRLAFYTSALNQQSPASRDSLARCDLIVDPDRPEMVREMRARNPNLRFVWRTMPQFAERWDGRPTWWIPDTLWSFNRRLQFYAYRNNWYLRDTAGRPIVEWNHNLLNWTRYCPRGTYGSAKGLRAAEWIPKALADICLSGRYWRPWAWDDLSTYNGVMFEALADCLGSYVFAGTKNADPDLDGIAEGVWSACGSGGMTQPLSVLMRAENAVFWAGLQREVFARAPDFPLLVNDSNRWMGPSWRVYLSGMKVENMFRDRLRPWGDWFYGGDPQRGYAWAEADMGRPGLPDRLAGWDLSLVCCYYDPWKTRAENASRARLALGTALLGDGFAMISIDEQHPWRIPEMDLDLGQPLGPFRAIGWAAWPGDSLYVRSFQRGYIKVNPSGRWLLGTPPRDARIVATGTP